MRRMLSWAPAFHQISLETANWFYTWGWCASLAGALITLLGIAFLFWGTRVRDHDAEKQFSALNNEASAARERAGHLEVRAGELEKAAADARAETERVRGLVLWRTLEERHANDLVASLVTGHGSVTIAYVANDPEALSFADRLAGAFVSANRFESQSKWTIQPDPRLYTDRNVFGLYVFGKDGDALKAVRHAFEFAGIENMPDIIAPPVTKIGAVTTSAAPPDTDVVIMVGSKHPPF